MATMAAAACTGGFACAQDDELIDDSDGLPIAVQPRFVVAPPAANADQVDQWVFGRLGGSAPARGKLDSYLALRIDDFERTLGLTELQKKKLELAGRGDIKRFFDRVQEAKCKFLRSQNEPNNNIWQEIQPLQLELNAGIFGDGSIFAKSITKTLNDDQAARYESVTRERIAERRKATIDWFVVHIDKGLGFSDEQRGRLVELLLNETPCAQAIWPGRLLVFSV